MDLSGLIWINLHITFLIWEKKKAAAHCVRYATATERIHSLTLAYSWRTQTCDWLCSGRGTRSLGALGLPTSSVFSLVSSWGCRQSTLHCISFCIFSSLTFLNIFHMDILLNFSLKMVFKKDFTYLFIFRERGGREKERERNINTQIACLSHTPSWGPGP